MNTLNSIKFDNIDTKHLKKIRTHLDNILLHKLYNTDIKNYQQIKTKLNEIETELENIDTSELDYDQFTALDHVETKLRNTQSALNNLNFLYNNNKPI